MISIWLLKLGLACIVFWMALLVYGLAAYRGVLDTQNRTIMMHILCILMALAVLYAAGIWGVCL